MARIRVEMNVTMVCPLRCPGCDRLSGIYPNPDEMMLDQVAAFLDQAKTAGGIGRCKLVGGDPAAHSNLPAVYGLFVEAVKSGVVESVKIETSGVIPIYPGLEFHPNIRFAGRRPAKKKRLPYLWAPCDLGLPTSLGCSHPRRCGFSIDSRGYLPCSPAIMIDRLFFGGAHYRQAIPTDGRVWGCEDLCRYCVYSAPEAWRQAHVLPLAEFTPEMKQPTRSWADALRRAGVEVSAVYEPALDRLDITD